jgi:hypothetical protein
VGVLALFLVVVAVLGLIMVTRDAVSSWSRSAGSRLRLFRWPRGDAYPSALVRRIFEEVVDIGDRTMPDRAVIVPHDVVVHAAVSDAEVLVMRRSEIEQKVSAEITKHSEREQWVFAGRLRIVEIVRDPVIAPGRPLVQRAPRLTTPLAPRRTLPAPPEYYVGTPPHYELVDVDGWQPPLVVPHNGGRIGRDSRSCVVLLEAPTVSREHADLAALPDGFIVRDLDSANGITVNGIRVTEAKLGVGDVLGLGRKVLLRLVGPGS